MTQIELEAHYAELRARADAQFSPYKNVPLETLDVIEDLLFALQQVIGLAARPTPTNPTP